MLTYCNRNLNAKFHENSSSRSRLDTYERTERRTGMKLKTVSRLRRRRTMTRRRDMQSVPIWRADKLHVFFDARNTKLERNWVNFSSREKWKDKPSDMRQSYAICNYNTGSTFPKHSKRIMELHRRRLCKYANGSK